MKYILIALTLFSCITKNKDSERAISTEPLDTIKTTATKPFVTPTLFEEAFIKGTTRKTEENATLELYGITIGKLKVPTGKIVICDPLHIEEYGKPFTQVFPTGEFPVQLSIAKATNGEWLSFARINFSEEPVAKWEFALLEGQSPIPVGGDDFYGYGIDGGVAIMMDQETIKSLNADTLTSMDTPFYKDMEKHYHGKWRYTMFNFGNLNAAGFTTGTGDGRYATYIGFDSLGKPCRLLTDFEILEWKK